MYTTGVHKARTVTKNYCLLFLLLRLQDVRNVHWALTLETQKQHGGLFIQDIEGDYIEIRGRESEREMYIRRERTRRIRMKHDENKTGVDGRTRLLGRARRCTSPRGAVAMAAEERRACKRQHFRVNYWN